jgi:ABC-type glutathione transport system ATPase component
VAAAGRRVALHIYEEGSNVVCSVQSEGRGGTEDRVEERTVEVNESGSPLLEVRGRVKDYPGVRALGGVDLTVTSGQVHCLIGQNGAGKSTLIKCVSGLVEPTAGEVRFWPSPNTSTRSGGSKDAMNQIAQGALYRATFLYNPSMSGSAVWIAKLIAEKKSVSELREPEVPSRIELPATTVTKENVAAVQNLGY